MAQAGDGHGHAVVIGAGLSGLTMARALAERFERVSVFERDRLPGEVVHRNGVPQGRHVHVLLPAGIVALERLFPGLIAEMVADGAPAGDMDSGRFCLSGHRLAPGAIDREGITASRPFIEAHVRRRVQRLPGVTISAQHDVPGLVTTADGRRVTGVRVTARGGPAADQERLVPAELVVDCSGRRSPVPKWLEGLGYAPPAVDELRVEVRYATRRYRLPAGALDGDRFLVVGPTPDNPRGGAAVKVEDGGWLVTLLAIGGERPSLDPQGYEDYATRLPVPDLAEAVRQGEAVDDPVGFRYAANTRRRYERLDRFPAGLLVAGDAVSSFNPTYGQGMTVAAREAVILEGLLGEADPPSPERWFGAITPLVDVAWDLAIGADLSIRSVEGRRGMGTRLLNAYIRRLHAAASQDPALTSLFLRATGLLDPPSRLVRPAAVMRVLRGNLTRRGAAPAPARTGGPEHTARGRDTGLVTEGTGAADPVGPEGEQ